MTHRLVCTKCAKEFERKRNRLSKYGILCTSCASTERNKVYQKTEKGKARQSAWLKAASYKYQKAYSKTDAYKAALALCPSRQKKYRSEYEIQKRLTDYVYKLKHNLRARLRGAIKNSCKTGSAVKELGCSISEFKEYLESMFDENMTWDNYGRTGWHIDHIVPLCQFDLTNYEQFKKACHYTNLQPLWAAENLRKQR